MKKLLPLALVYCLVSLQNYLSAQVAPPCPTPPPPGAESCPAACVYCNFDGYMGINNGSPSGGNLVCGQITLHNDQWFGFVAGSQSITINIATNNCQNGDGLQAAFFENCQEDAVTCNPGSGGGGGQPLTLSYSNFVPGQTYYLMIDGWVGDICDYTIEVLDGSVTPPSPSQPAVPQGPTKVCPGAVVEYTIPQVPGAGYYLWTTPPGSKINNSSSNSLNLPAPDGNTITVTFGASGGQVCVKVGNACAAPLQSCINVINQPIPPTVKPDVVVCFEDLPYSWDETPGTTISLPGTFNLTSIAYDSYLGCDSTVKQKIIAKAQIKTNLGTQYVCEGTCLVYNGNSYCNTGGPFQEILESFQGCDSVVQFTVITVPATAVIGPVQTIDCNNPTLTLSSSGSTTGPTVTYSWTNAGWTPVGNQATQIVNNGGGYNLIVSNNFGPVSCKDTASVIVPANNAPPGVSINGGNITCIASSVTLTASSPTNGVNFVWNGPGITPANKNLQNPVVSLPGAYSVTVTNPVNGCTSIASTTVTADNTPPAVSASGGTITCTQQSVVLAVTANPVTATYHWSGPCITPAIMNLQNPDVNCTGMYAVTVTNSVNGCTTTATAVVDQNTSVPAVNAGPDQTITCLASSVILSGSGNAGGAPALFSWSGLGIHAGNQNSATPSVDQADTYILTVTNTINGCFKKDTVVVNTDLALPVAGAGADQTITCGVATVKIGSASSSQGPGFSASWTGPDINAGNQNQYTPTVGQSGLYVLTVLNAGNGCSSKDSVVVNLNTLAPTASAGSDQILTCSSPNGIVLNGSGTPSGITYLWSGAGIGSNNDTLQNPSVTVPDTYTLQVTNPVNGCTATDQVVIAQDANLPTANAGADLTLNCSVSSVNINASGSSGGPGITYQWSGPGISGGNATLQNPSNIVLPGTYSLTVTNTTNNCFNTDILVIAIDTVLPAASAGAGLILNCYNNATDTLDASASSTGPVYSLLWAGPGITPANQNDLMPIVSQPGVYLLTVTNTDNTCTATTQTTVLSDLAPPTADAGTDPTINCVTTSATIGGNSSSGAGFAYLWAGPGISPVNAANYQPLVSVPGNYTLVVTNTVNGCTAGDNMIVHTDAVYPTADAGAAGLITCLSPLAVLNGSGSSSGAGIQMSWSGPDISAANQSLVSPNVSLPGTYILSVTNTANSCVSTDTVFVTENTGVPNASAGPDGKLDCATTSITLDGSASSASGGFSSSWNGPNGFSSTQPSPVITAPGTYDVLITDNANGCTATDQVIITQDIATPSADAGAGITLTCAQPSLSIDGSGSTIGSTINYVWQGPGINTSNFNVQSPVVSDSGTYVLIVTNIQNSCTATDQVYVAMNANLPASDAGLDQTLTCQKDTLQLNGSLSSSGPGIQYSWTGPGIVAGQQNAASPNVYTQGVYTLTVLDIANGCSKTDIVNVGADFTPPVSDAGSDQVLTCANSTTGVPLSSGSSSSGPGFTLLWSGPGITAANQSSPSPIVLVTGNYTLLITNTQSGCTSTDNVNVLQDQNLPVANAGADQTITCSQLLVALDGSGSSSPGGNIQFTWTGPGISAANQSDAIPSVSQPGAYVLTVTNPITGCKATDNVVVALDNQPPAVTITTDTITCGDPQGALSVNSSLANSTYEWSGPGIDISNINLASLLVGDPGSYSVTVTAPNGCTQIASAQMYVDANFPDGGAEGTELNCYNNGIGTVSGVVNTPGATYFWTGPGGFQSNMLTATVTQTGVYTFTIVSPNGCKRPIAVDVTQNFTVPQVQASVAELLDCNTTSLTINTAGTSTGPVFTYNWTTSGGNIVSGSNGLSPVVNQSGAYTLIVSNNINGCKDSSTVQVSTDPSVPSAFDLVVKDIRCFGDHNGFITVNGITGGTEPFLYTLNGNSGSATNQFSGLTAGNYTLTLQDANGCLLDTLIAISEPGQLLVDLGPDIEVQLGEEATVLAIIANTTPLQSVTWNYAPNCDSTSTDCREFTYLPIQSYRHQVTVKDSNGCIARDQINVIVQKNRLVYVPNVFNPASSEPFNNQLMIQGGTGVAKVKSWQIFDRWGSAVFTVSDFPPNDPAYAWDGKVKGDEGNTGVYAWFAEIEFIDGEVQLFKGDVTIVR